MELNYICKNCQENKTIYSVNCLIEFDIDIDKLKNNNKLFTTNNIFQYLKEDSYCKNCNKPNKIIKKFINLPQYLIIIFHKEINDLYFTLNEYFDIKDFIRSSIELLNNNLEKTQYELVSLIQDVSVAFCKSFVDKKWYKYNSKDNKRLPKTIQLDKNIKNSIPYLLIYKIKK